MNQINLIDLHVHTNFSDGKLSMHEIVDLYGRRGFAALAVTDHLADTSTFIGQFSNKMNLTLNEKKFSSYLREFKFQKKRAQDLYGMDLHFGFEVTKNFFSNDRSCHVLIIGYEDYLEPHLPIEEILLTAQKNKAMTIAAHPFHTGEFEFQSLYLWTRRNDLKNLITAWETNFRDKLVSEVLNSGLPLVASSDFHHQKNSRSWYSAMSGPTSLESLTENLLQKKIQLIYKDFTSEEQRSPVRASDSLRKDIEIQQTMYSFL